MDFDTGRTHGSESASENGRRSTITRRSTLVAVGALASFGSGASIAAAIPRGPYGDVVNIVEDYGADPTGEEPIDEALAAALEPVEYDFSHYAPADGWPMPAIDEIDFDDDGIKIVFPPGEYTFGEGGRGFGFTRWGISPGIPEEQQFLGKVALVGEGRRDATLRPADNGRHPVVTLWGRDLRIENFRLDQTPDDTSTGITAQGSDALLIRDIHVDGRVTGDYQPRPIGDPNLLEDPFAVNPGVFGPTGDGLIENFQAPDGVEPLSRKGGSWVTFHHAGDLLYRRCEFSNFSDNAIYGSPPGLPHGQGGAVKVENSVFRNNNVTAIRLGSPGSYGKNCVVVTEADEIPATPWGAITSRAGWVWYDFDGYYKNIDVSHDHPAGYGILDHGDGTHDLHLAIENCRMELNGDGSWAVRAVDPGVETLTIKNLHVSGDAGDGPALPIANCEVDIRNLCLSQTGDDRDGIVLTNATGAIRNPRIDVTGEAIVADEDSDVEVRNLRENANCAPPARAE